MIGNWNWLKPVSEIAASPALIAAMASCMIDRALLEFGPFVFLDIPDPQSAAESAITEALAGLDPAAMVWRCNLTAGGSVVIDVRR